MCVMVMLMTLNKCSIFVFVCRVYLLRNFILYNKKLRVIYHNLIRIVLNFFYCTIIVCKLLNLIVSRFLIYHFTHTLSVRNFLIVNSVINEI